MLRGHHKLADFMAFEGAYVVEINIAGCRSTALLDCGASKTLATSAYILHCIGTQYKPQLQQYTGLPFHTAGGEILIVEGTLNVALQLGALIWHESIIVYTAAHPELLLGHNVLKKFSLLIAPKSLYIPLEILRNHRQQTCNRLGTLATPMLLLLLSHTTTVAPGESVRMQCHVAPNYGDTSYHTALDQFAWVAHSEDLQATTDPKEMRIFYQLVEFRNGTFSLNYQNTTEDYIYLQEGDEIANAEMVDCLAKTVVMASDPCLNLVYHTLCIPKSVAVTPTVSQLFLHETPEVGVEQTPAVDFSQIDCNENEPQLRINLIDYFKTIPSVFSTSKYDIGCTNDSEIIHFSVVTGATPQNCKGIPTSPALLDRANDMIQGLLDRGCIDYSPSNNCWKAAMFFVLKSPPLSERLEAVNAIDMAKFKAKLPIRAICDYRGLNRRLRKRFPVHPLPPLRSIMDKLVTKSYISNLDLRQSFWNCSISPSAQLLTGFEFNNNHYISKKLPHGITFCSQAFQALICRILRKHNLEQVVFAYVDDLLVASDNVAEHEKAIKTLVHALHESGLKINLQKSIFGCSSKITLFGWDLDIATSQISPTQSKIAAIKKMCPPRNTKGCRRFVGQFTHYNQAIPRIAAILGPIFQLCSDRTPFRWAKEHQCAFEEALAALGRAECLILPDFTKPFYLSSDAAKGQAASFSVWQRNQATKLLQPIRHGSFAFKKAAKLYSQYKAEAMSICHGLQSSMLYFQFGQNFLITDVAAIQWLVKYRHSAQQIYAWSLLICSVDLKIIAVACSSAVIKFNDAFCRPVEARKQLQKQIIYNDKKAHDLPLMDRSTTNIIHKNWVKT